MRVFLEYAINLVNKRAFLRAGYRLCVGSSRLADLHIEGVPQLEAQHFELIHTGDRVAVRNLIPAKPLLVNQQAINEEHTLGHDDRISAGGLLFRLIVEQDISTSQNIASLGTPASAVAAAEPAGSSVQHEEKTLATGIRQQIWRGADNHPAFAAFLQPTADGLATFGLADFKADQLPFPEDCTNENDLLQNASDTLRESHSLHLWGTGEFAAAWDWWTSRAQAGKPTTLLLTAGERAGLADKLKMFAPWMVEPDTLQFHLCQNTKRMLSQWFEVVQGFAIFNSHQEIHYFSK